MTQPEFTSDWFSNNLETWPKVFENAGLDPQTPKVVVEIGSYEGRSAIWFCEHLLKHSTSRIYCIDTFAGGIEHTDKQKGDIQGRFERNIALARCADKVMICKGESWRELAKLVAEGVQADVVYIDGSHQAPDVLEDAILSFRVVKPGGIIIFDDYRWSIERHGSEDILNSPKLAIDMFANIFRRRVRFYAQSAIQIMYCRTN